MSTTDNDAIVTAFCDAWGRSDVDAIMSAFADDAVYHNIPMDPIVGKDAIDAVIRSFLTNATITFETRHQVADGDLVMNERVDTLTQHGAADADARVIPVTGVFELRDGKIVAWRDYFDLKAFTG